MPENPTIAALIESNVEDNTTGLNTPEDVREVLHAINVEIAAVGDDLQEQIDNIGPGGGAVDSVNGQTGVVVLDADDIADGTTNKAFTATEKTKLSALDTGGTSTTFNGTIKFDKILGRYATVNSSDISGPITVDATGAVQLGCYYLQVVEDGGGAPTFTGFVFPEDGPAYDTTDGNSTLYIFQHVLGTYHGGVILQGVPDVNQAPTATSVSISGTTQEGQTLTGSYTYGDAESDPEGTSLKQWYRADDSSGTGRAAISGATNTTYILQTADVGKYIQYGVTPVATSGTTPGAEGVSAYTSAITAIGANNAPVASSVSISGTVKQGQTLTGSYTYSDVESDVEGASVKQWYRADDTSGTNRAAISGATNTTYILQAADVGKYVQYQVTPVAVTGTSPGSAAVSSYTTIVLDNVVPTVTGLEALDGETIEATQSESTSGTHAGYSAKVNGGSAIAATGISSAGVTRQRTYPAASFANGDTITESYNSGTGNTVDSAGNALASYTDVAVTNSIPASGPAYLTFTNRTGSITGGATGTPTGTFSGPAGEYMVSDEQMAADGMVDAVIPAGGAGANEIVILALDDTSTHNDYVATHKVYIFPHAGTYHTSSAATSFALNPTGVAYATGHHWGLYRVGTTIKARYSSNGGASYTDIHTFAGSYGATMNAKVSFATGSTTITEVKGEGFA